MSDRPTLVIRLDGDRFGPGDSCDTSARKLLNDTSVLLDSKWSTPHSEWLSRGGGWGPFAPARGDGVWVAFHSDRSGVVAFGSELDALRYALPNHMHVEFRPFGVDLVSGFEMPA